jgi:hypothetical protein
VQRARPRWLCPALALAFSAALAACGGAHKAATPSPGSGLAVTSTAFVTGGPIPATFTCDGADVSPPLSWSVTPRGTAAYAVFLEDPDAPGGTFTHWVLLDLPATTTSLPQDVPRGQRPATGGAQAQNDAGVTGYSGPCPPAGPAHRYRFTVYALDRPLGIVPVPSKGAALKAMNGHILSQGTLVGTYQRAARWAPPIAHPGCAAPPALRQLQGGWRRTGRDDCRGRCAGGWTGRRAAGR